MECHECGDYFWYAVGLVLRCSSSSCLLSYLPFLTLFFLYRLCPCLSLKPANVSLQGRSQYLGAFQADDILNNFKTYSLSILQTNSYEELFIANRSNYAYYNIFSFKLSSGLIKVLPPSIMPISIQIVQTNFDLGLKII